MSYFFSNIVHTSRGRTERFGNGTFFPFSNFEVGAANSLEIHPSVNPNFNTKTEQNSFSKILVCIVVSCLVCTVVVVLCVLLLVVLCVLLLVVLCVLLSSYVYLLYCVCIAVFTLDAGLLTRSQYS